MARLLVQALRREGQSGHRQVQASGRASEPDSTARVLAAARVADWSGQVENVLIGGERLAVLAKVGDEQQVAKLIEEKGAQALCFKGPFDVRLATAPRTTQGRQARQVGEPSATVTPVDSKSQACPRRLRISKSSQPGLPWASITMTRVDHCQEGDLHRQAAPRRLCAASARPVCTRTSPALTWALSFNVEACSAPTLQCSTSKEKSTSSLATKRCFLMQPFRMPSLSRWRRSATSRAATSSACPRLLVVRVLQRT